MPSLRVMTFNVENLYSRFHFREREAEDLVSLLDAHTSAERKQLIRTHWNVLNDEIRTFTALTLLEGDPDVVCLQEVEHFFALRSFHDRYLRRLRPRGWGGYPHQILIEGNDRRGIDVAILSRYPLDRIVTHQHLEADIPNTTGTHRERVFRRDCLEVHVDVQGSLLPIFVCHFKSMSGGREETRAYRQLEAEAARGVISKRFPDPASAYWLLAGDLNDYTELEGQPDSGHGLAPLLREGFSVDLVKRIEDPGERWTHYYPDEDQYSQLDYLLASPALAARNPGAVPRILRQGQPHRAARYQGPRWPRVGYERPKASDHCAVVVALDFPSTT